MHKGNGKLFFLGRTLKRKRFWVNRDSKNKMLKSNDKTYAKKKKNTSTITLSDKWIWHESNLLPKEELQIENRGKWHDFQRGVVKRT